MPVFNRKSSRFRQDERGTTLIEMSVVIPVVLAVGLGTLEFGNLFYRYHLMANAVRDAARFAAGYAGDVCNDATLQTKVANIARQTGQLSASENLAWTSGATITVSCGSSFDNKRGTFRGGLTIRSVTVSGTVPYQGLGFLGFLGLASPTLTVSHQERVIGVR